MHFAGYYVDTKAARASHRRFLLGKTRQRLGENPRIENPGLFRRYTCNRATGQFVVTLFRCTRKVAVDYLYEQRNERERERDVLVS